MENHTLHSGNPTGAEPNSAKLTPAHREELVEALIDRLVARTPDADEVGQPVFPTPVYDEDGSVLDVIDSYFANARLVREAIYRASCAEEGSQSYERDSAYVGLTEHEMIVLENIQAARAGK